MSKSGSGLVTDDYVVDWHTISTITSVEKQTGVAFLFPRKSLVIEFNCSCLASNDLLSFPISKHVQFHYFSAIYFYFIVSSRLIDLLCHLPLNDVSILAPHRGDVRKFCPLGNIYLSYWDQFCREGSEGMFSRDPRQDLKIRKCFCSDNHPGR